MNHLPPISIRVIAHSNQKYDTAGDYCEMYDNWYMKISKMKDWRYEALVTVHELIEMILTKHHGVDWNDIDIFDMAGEGKDHPDPGTLPSAPYHNEHMLATQIEKKLAKMLNVDWKEYDESFNDLKWGTQNADS